jgi:hypothetical protein
MGDDGQNYWENKTERAKAKRKGVAAPDKVKSPKKDKVNRGESCNVRQHPMGRF